MDQSTPSPSQTSPRKQPGRTSPPPSTGPDADAPPPDTASSHEQASPASPPAPLLRPAQGAWDKTYAFGKQRQPQGRSAAPKDTSPPTYQSRPSSSPASRTRSKDRDPKRTTSYPVPAQDARVSITHAESHARSQASGLVASSSSGSDAAPRHPASASASAPNHQSQQQPARASSASEHYRHAGPATAPGSQASPPPPSLPPPPSQYYQTPPPPRAHARVAASQLYASSGYYAGAASAYAHAPAAGTPHLHYGARRYEPDPYPPPPRNQTASAGYASMSTSSYAHPQDDLLPVVILLMEDIRCAGPEPDYQLAEVNVSLRPHVGDDQTGGWWADGEEVMKALQLTPSRLEGPAKVFARRGKYRHCFVRFSEDNMMECQPSSLMVSREKTIELIIEPNLEGRASARDAYPLQHDPYARSYAPLAAGPSQPRAGIQDHDYAHYQMHPHAYPSSQYYPPLQNPNPNSNPNPNPNPYPNLTPIPNPNPNPNPNSNGKRTSAEMMSSVADDHASAKRPKTSATSSPSRRPRPPLSRPGTSGGAPQATPNTRLSSPEEGVPGDPISPYGPFQRHELLPVAAKAPKEVVNAAIVAYLRSHIQSEDGYIEFAASKGRLLPIPDLLKGYRFATRIVNAWANRKTPPTIEACPNKRITKNHVLQALFRQTSWGSDCEQTLQLADKYGPGGAREDPRVVEILSGGSMLPEKSGDKTQGRSQGSVALLDFLKDVDKEHKAKQEDESRKSASSGGKEPNEGARGEAD